MLEINKSILKVAHKRSFVVPDSFTGLSSETVAYEINYIKTGCVTCTVCFYIVFFFLNSCTWSNLP